MAEVGERAVTPARERGRRRSERSHRAIVAATQELLVERGYRELTIEGVAARAGVGKQTIYRWWPSRGALLLEAVAEQADADIEIPDAGTLRVDLELFLRSTFAAATPRRIALLRVLAAEAQLDPTMAAPFQAFAAKRRAALASLLERGVHRGELAPETDLTLLLHVAFGVLWYRLLIDPRPLDEATAHSLTGLLLGGQATDGPSTP